MKLRQISEANSTNLSGNIDEFELQQKAEDAAAGDNKQKTIIANQMKEQEKLLQQHDIEMRKRLEPDIKKLNTTASKLNTNIALGQKDATKNLERYNEIDNDALEINTSVNSLNKLL